MTDIEDIVADKRFSANWCVLHLKPRCEKKTRKWLSIFRVTHILPTRTEVKRVQRRKVETELPIFPGYIFVRMPPERRLDVIKSNMVVSVIPVSVKDARPLVHQLRQVIKAAAAASEMFAVPMYTQGEHVRIRRGPFKGVEGVLKRTKGKEHLVLNVEMLDCAVEVIVDVLDCQKI